MSPFSKPAGAAALYWAVAPNNYYLNRVASSHTLHPRPISNQGWLAIPLSTFFFFFFGIGRH